MKEGWWYWRKCLSVPGGAVIIQKVAEGSFSHGKPEGVWRWYNTIGSQQAELRQSATFHNGTADGPFARVCGAVTVVGETKGGSGPIDWICFATGSSLNSLNSGKFWGTWQFYGQNGLLLGQSVLNSDGSGHLAVPAAIGDGSLNAEGEIENGVPVGVWKLYDQRYGFSCLQQTFTAGQVGLPSPGSPCPNPGLINHPAAYVPPPPPAPGPPARPQPPTTTISIANCSVSPQSIGLGAAATLTATLSAPAPPGGITAIVDVVANGSMDTLDPWPISLPFVAGSTTASLTLHTHNVQSAASKITFSVRIGATPVRNAQLDIR